MSQVHLLDLITFISNSSGAQFWACFSKIWSCQAFWNVTIYLLTWPNFWFRMICRCPIKFTCFLAILSCFSYVKSTETYEAYLIKFSSLEYREPVVYVSPTHKKFFSFVFCCSHRFSQYQTYLLLNYAQSWLPIPNISLLTISLSFLFYHFTLHFTIS